MIFLLLLLASCHAATVDEQLTGIARSLLTEDLFLSHLRSSLVNESIDPCDNFYRRICPVDMPVNADLWNKLILQMQSIMNVHDFMKPSEKGLELERLRASRFRDRTNYTSPADIAKALNKIDANFLIDYLVPTIVKDVNSLSKVNTAMNPNAVRSSQFMDDTILRLLRSNFNSRKAAILQVLSHDVAHIIGKYDYLNANEGDDSKAGVMDNIHHRFERLMRDETTLMNLMKLLGSEHDRAVDRLDTIIAAVIEEYERAYLSAAWSQRENRFGYSQANLYTAHFKNISFAIFYTKRFSISHEKKESLLSLFEKLFIKQYKKLSELAHMSRLRLALSQKFAVDEIIHEHLGTALPMKSNTKSRTFEAFAVEEDTFHPAVVLMNQIFSMHAVHSSQLASVIGFTGFIFAHEIYHQVQRFNKLIVEDTREYEKARSCTNAYTAVICDRFTEVTCMSGFSEKEDSADIYGSQIAHIVLQKLVGDDLDKIAVPDLALTHRELFYSSNAVQFCSFDSRAQWMEADTHNGMLYRANTVLSHLPDFKQLFACYDDDLMSIPEKMRCPLFSS